METFLLIAELVLVFAAILIGVRVGGVGIGAFGAVGTAVLVFVFGEQVGSPPIDALLIIVAVILTTSAVQASGGIDAMVAVAARLIVRAPRSITIVAPIVTFIFSMGAGTSNIAFLLLPVIQEVSERAGIRPSKPISVSVVATSIALACSPVSAAMAAMIVIMEGHPGGWPIVQLMLVTVPAALIGVVLTGLIVSRFGGKDPIDSTGSTERLSISELKSVQQEVSGRAKATALIYLAGVLGIVVFGLLPELRPTDTEGERVGVAVMIQLLMFVTAAVVLLVGRPKLDEIPNTAIFQGGMVAAIAFFGLAWMLDTFLKAHTDTVEATMQQWVSAAPWALAIGIFAVAVLTTSQSTATRMVVPIGLAAGLPIGLTTGLWVGALGGIYLLPTNGLQITAANIDSTGSTKIGTRLYDHSFFVPSLLITVITVVAGAGIGLLVGG